MNVANNQAISPYRSRKFNMLPIQPGFVKPQPLPLPEMTPVDIDQCEKSDPFAPGKFTRPPERPSLPNIRLDDEGDPNTLRTFRALA